MLESHRESLRRNPKSWRSLGSPHRNIIWKSTCRYRRYVVPGGLKLSFLSGSPYLAQSYKTCVLRAITRRDGGVEKHVRRGNSITLPRNVILSDIKQESAGFSMKKEKS